MTPLASPQPASLAATAELLLPPGVRAVVCDVVHTLVEPWPPVTTAYGMAGRRHGLDLAADVIQRRFREAWRRQEVLDADASPPHATSRWRETDRWRQIVDHVFAGAAETGAIFAELWTHFGRPDAWRALPGGVEIVRQVRSAGLPLALASNFDERLLGLTPVVEPLTLADHVFASSELGWRKPARQFFQVIEERLGLRPEELLLVGDDPELDVAAALRAGWQARQIAPSGSCPTSSRSDP